MTNELTNVDDLEAVVGARTDAGTYKSIPILDPHCDTMLGLSPLSFLGHVTSDDTLATVVLGGAPGHASAASPTELAMPGLDATGLVDGTPVGLLTLIPGYGETLRVNGRLSLAGDTPTIAVEEAFVHCAKAIIRSKLWKADGEARGAWDQVDELRGGAELLDDAAVGAFLAASPFVTLASVDGDGKADVSPKGDPIGFVHVLDADALHGRRLAVPDRPGNLRTDTLHNLLDRPELSLVALVPGSDHVLTVSGRATTTDDESIRAALVANGKVPLAAVVIEVAEVVLRRESAIGASSVWDRSLHVEPGALPRASQIWSDHVQIHAGLSTEDEEQRLIPVDAMHDGIQQNYRDGLY